MGDTSKIQYLIRDGVLRLHGQLRYQDRDLRIACLKLIACPQHSVCLDLSDIPSLCSPEIQFVTKMVHLAADNGKHFRVRLSKTLRQIFSALEVDGLVEIEQVEEPRDGGSTALPASLPPGPPAPGRP